MELLGSPPGTPDELPDLPRVGLDWNNLDVTEEHFPRLQRERAQRTHEVALFSEQNLREFYLCHLMVLYPNQPDMIWDYPLWWDHRQQHEYRFFFRTLSLKVGIWIVLEVSASSGSFIKIMDFPFLLINLQWQWT